MKPLGKTLLPAAAAALAVITDRFIPDSTLHPEADHPYFLIVMAVVLAVVAVLFIVSVFVKQFREAYAVKAPFYCGVIVLLIALNFLTAKFAILPVLYFPTLDRIFGVLITDFPFIGKCLLYSLRLLLIGWFIGAAAGVVTGIAIGFCKPVTYWLYPVVRVLGPIPSTAWIPLALIAFPSAVSASSFIIALAVWFPTTILTMSGIASIPNSYFEAGYTLGAGRWYSIFKIGVPAALPHIFIGLFNGTTSSFITLVTAEMLGAKYGIGWYINWQKEMMSYANVYAGLIVMSALCFVMITLLFKVRDKVLVWQKGIIKW